MVDVIVTYREMPGKAEAKRIRGLGGETHRAYGRLPMRAMRIPGHALEHLANGNGVKFITADGTVESFSASARLTANLPVGNSVTPLIVVLVWGLPSSTRV